MNTPKFLNKQSTKIFKSIVSQLNGQSYLKIENSKTFMPLSVERLQAELNNGFEFALFSFTHYYEQNGDLVPDPDVMFLTISDKQGDIQYVYPTEITHCTGKYVSSLQLKSDLSFDTFIPSEQRDLTDFCNMWMKNIKFQQCL